jgi:hypothetical protein
MRYRRMRHGLAVGLAAIFLVPGCGGDGDDDEPVADEAAEEQPGPDQGSPPTPEQMAGVWLTVGSERVGWFRADGTFAIDDRGLVDIRPAASGAFSIEDSRTELVADEGSDVCSAEERWVFDAHMPDEGWLEVTVVEDSTGECAIGVGTRETWIRVSPRSPATGDLSPEPGDEGEVPADRRAIAGVWLHVDSGHVLRLEREGAYVLDDEGRLGDEAADVGRYRVGEGGRLTFTSGARSRACEEGAAWAWDGAEIAFGAATEDAAGIAGRREAILRGSGGQDDCERDIPADAEWLRLSP